MDSHRTAAALNGGDNVGDHVGLVVAREVFIDVLGTGGSVVDGGAQLTGDVAFLVAAAEELVNLAAVDLQVGAAETHIGTGVVVGGGWVAVVACGGVAVAAAEDAVEAAAVDDGQQALGVGGVAASVEVLDGVVAAVDKDDGALGGTGKVAFGTVVGLVAAAVHTADCKVLPVVAGGCGGVVGVCAIGSIVVIGGVDTHDGVAEGGAGDIVAAEDVAIDYSIAGVGAVAFVVDNDVADLDEGGTLVAVFALGTHGGHFAAAVDAAVDGAGVDVHLGVAVGAAGVEGYAVGDGLVVDLCGLGSGEGGMAVAAAVDVAVLVAGNIVAADGAAINVYLAVC